MNTRYDVTYIWFVLKWSVRPRVRVFYWSAEPSGDTWKPPRWKNSSQCAVDSENSIKIYLFIYYNRQRTRRSLICHTAKSVLNTKEPVKYTNKLIKRQPIQNYREYLQLTKNLILANNAVNDWLRWSWYARQYCVSAIGWYAIRDIFIRFKQSQSFLSTS